MKQGNGCHTGGETQKPIAPGKLLDQTGFCYEYDKVRLNFYVVDPLTSWRLVRLQSFPPSVTAIGFLPMTGLPDVHPWYCRSNALPH